jgi:hypothetical protein
MFVVRRLLRVTATALSLALCVATALLWLRSGRTSDSLFVSSGGTRWEFASNQGQIICIRFRPWRKTEPLTYSREPIAPTSVAPAWGPLGVGWKSSAHVRLLGFAYATGTYWPPIAWRLPRAPFLYLAVPHGFIVLLTLTAPLGAAWRRARRSRRPPADLCPNCKYDLRATPHRCPECGRVP